jgi:hypothetical protein
MGDLQHSSQRSLLSSVSLAINGILTSIDCEVPNIACATFAEFVDFHTKPALL